MPMQDVGVVADSDADEEYIETNNKNAYYSRCIVNGKDLVRKI